MEELGLIRSAILSMVKAARTSEWYAATQVRARLKQPVEPFILTPRDSYVPNAKLEHCIYKSATRGFGGGIDVLVAPAGVGKTYATEQVLNKLQTNSEIDGCCIVPMNELNGSAPRVRVLKELGVPEEYISKSPDTHFSEIIPENLSRTVIVMDQFDHLESYDLLRSFVTSVAEDSTRTKKYRVLLLVTNVNFAKTILGYNSMEKIRPASGAFNPAEFKWDVDMCMELHSKLANEKMPLEMENVRRLSSLAGTPGFVIDLNHCEDLDDPATKTYFEIFAKERYILWTRMKSLMTDLAQQK